MECLLAFLHMLTPNPNPHPQPQPHPNPPLLPHTNTDESKSLDFALATVRDKMKLRTVRSARPPPRLIRARALFVCVFQSSFILHHYVVVLILLLLVTRLMFKIVVVSVSINIYAVHAMPSTVICVFG
jgi:hypothetical protein